MDVSVRYAVQLGYLGHPSRAIEPGEVPPAVSTKPAAGQPAHIMAQAISKRDCRKGLKLSSLDGGLSHIGSPEERGSGIPLRHRLRSHPAD